MKHFILPFITLFFLASCITQKKATTASAGNPLIQHVWDMSLYGKDSISGTGVFLIFKDSNNVTGFDGCRIFSAKTKWANKQLRFSDFNYQGNRKCDSTNVSGKIQYAFNQPYNTCFKGKNLCLCKKGKTVMLFQERVIEVDTETPTDSTATDAPSE